MQPSTTVTATSTTTLWEESWNSSDRGTGDRGSVGARVRRGATALGGLALLVLVALASNVGVASAHAVLEATTPSDGAVVAHAPGRVLVRFGEAVTPAPNGIKVYDRKLHQVQQGRAGHVTGDDHTVGVRLAAKLPAGTYTVTWRVISADSHPVSGGFRFSIKHPSTAAKPTSTDTNGGGVGAGLLAIARWVGYAGAAVAIGAVLVLLWLWPAGRGDRRARRLGWCGYGALVVGGLAQFAIQGPYAAGAPLSQIADPALLGQTAATRFGQVLLLRLGLLVLLAGWLADVFDPHARSPRRVSAGTGAVVGLAILATIAASGHAATGTLAPLSVASDLAHLTAMTLWLGGLVLLIVCLLARRRAGPLPSGLLVAVLPRFSRLATGCVAALVATGTYQTWRNVRYLPAFIDTTYGLLLVAKLGAFLGLLVLGELARRWTARHYQPPATPGLRRVGHASGPGPAQPATGQPEAVPGQPAPTGPAVGRLRRGVAIETLTGTVVLALTAVLTGTAQAAQAYTPTFHTEITSGTTRLQVTAEPAHTGPATVRVRLRTQAGAPVPVTHVHGSLALPERHVGPLPVTFHTSGNGGTRASARTQFPTGGDWLLQLTVQTSPTAATTYQVHIPVTG